MKPVIDPSMLSEEQRSAIRFDYLVNRDAMLISPRREERIAAQWVATSFERLFGTGFFRNGDDDEK